MTVIKAIEVNFFEVAVGFLSNLNESDKRSFVTILVETMEANLADILKSANAAHGGATHEDAVAKSKYDTHGLELSYLAGSQYERANILGNEISSLKSLPIKVCDTDSPIQHGTLVELSSEKDQRIIYLSPYGAGLTVVYQSKSISVVSPQSPLGNEIIDSYEGDEINTQGQVSEIIGIL